MKRAMVLGFGVVFGSAALAQPPAPQPVSVYPGTTVRRPAAQDATPAVPAPPAVTPAPAAVPAPAVPQVLPQVQPGRADPLQPLAGLLAMPLPTAPTVAAGACSAGTCATGSCSPACGTPLFSTVARDGAGKSRPCLERTLNWLTWHPGPSILPVLTPTPYQAPLRAYFTCTPLKNPGYPAACSAAKPDGGAAPASGCADGSCKARPASAFGVATRPALAAPVPSQLALVIPLPPASAGPSECGGRGAVDRLLGLFAGGCSTCPTGTGVTPVGYQSAAPSDFRFAR